MAQRLPRLRGFGSRAAPTRHPVAAGQAQTSLSAPPSGARPKPYGARVRHTGLKKYGATCWCFRIPVARAEYRSPTGSIQASPCLSPRRVVCARRVGERPVGRGTQGVFARSGVSFSLVPFSWTSKRKEPAVGQPPTSTRGRRPLDKMISYLFLSAIRNKCYSFQMFCPTIQILCI